MARSEDLWDEMFAECLVALRTGKHQAVFQYWEENYSEFLADGERGVTFYRELLELVSKSGRPNLVSIFRGRFDPLLNRAFLEDKVVSDKWR